jgi:hypothetical protein
MWFSWIIWVWADLKIFEFTGKIWVGFWCWNIFWKSEFFYLKDIVGSNKEFKISSKGFENNIGEFLQEFKRKWHCRNFFWNRQNKKIVKIKYWNKNSLVKENKWRWRIFLRLKE